jgi:hypothetical protein
MAHLGSASRASAIGPVPDARGGDASIRCVPREVPVQNWKLAIVVGGVALGGVVVGANCFGARPASAQEAVTYSRCFVARQESVDTRNDGTIETPNLDHTILIPRNWEVVGGGGGEGNYLGFITLCHR